MTAQLADVVRYSGERWDLAGVQGEPLFEPAELGLKARPTSTACRRGFACSYALHEGFLLLDCVDIALDGNPPKLFERLPQPSTHPIGFTTSYKNLAHPIPFTGGLLLGRNFITALYVHMGFHPAWKYEHVVEVDLQRGQVMQVSDRTDRMAELRERHAQDPKPRSETGIKDWIARAFSRRY